MEALKMMLGAVEDELEGYFAGDDEDPLCELLWVNDDTYNHEDMIMTTIDCLFSTLLPTYIDNINYNADSVQPKIDTLLDTFHSLHHELREVWKKMSNENEPPKTWKDIWYAE